MGFYCDQNFYPESSIGYLLRVCHQLGMGQLDQAFADEGLTGVQWSTMIAIYVGKASNCAELARMMAYDKGAMTRMIDTLEQRGWVLRDRDCADRRLINLSLTAAGEAVTRSCRDRVIDCWNGWLADWSDDEVAGLIAQLQRLHRTLEGASTCAA
jgi:DNA-binding MarR family transcriptional regulator